MSISAGKFLITGSQVIETGEEVVSCLLPGLHVEIDFTLHHPWLPQGYLSGKKEYRRPGSLVKSFNIAANGQQAVGVYQRAEQAGFSVHRSG